MRRLLDWGRRVGLPDRSSARGVWRAYGAAGILRFMATGDARRLATLQAMGIDLWVRRAAQSYAPSLAPAALAREPAAEAPGRRDPAPAAGVDGLDWDDLAAAVAGCTACSLHRTRTQTVFGVGDRAAQWMFVGEAPGFEEDRQGAPFVGRAGQLLNAMLFALGLERDAVYIANVLKCRPPENRDPQGEEVLCCEPYLHRQVKLVSPKVIVALGRFAAQSLLKSTRPIGKMRGERFTYADTGIPLIVTYHPAYLLRNPADKRRAWDDLLLARTVLESP
jgi:DNA polymerase